MWRWIADRRYGRVLEVRSAFLHSSDLDPGKPINWKRRADQNGEYGVMGDLGMHALHLPLRAGWFPKDVRAILSDVVRERPDGRGGTVPCDTWDNALLLCEVEAEGDSFPLRIETKRIAPGETNTWIIEVDGTEGSIAYTTKQPKTLRWMDVRARRAAGLERPRPRLRVGVSVDHRGDLRVRLLRRRPPDVGRLPRRARPRPGRHARSPSTAPRPRRRRRRTGSSRRRSSRRRPRRSCRSAAAGSRQRRACASSSAASTPRSDASTSSTGWKAGSGRPARRSAALTWTRQPGLAAA